MQATASATVVDKLVPVAVDSLCQSTGFDFDLYVWPDANAPPRLYRERAIPFTDESIRKLLDRGIRVLYISSQGVAAYRDHISSNVLANPSISLVRRFEILRDSARSLLTDGFEKSDRDAIADSTGFVGTKLAEMICSSSSLLCDLFGVMHHDYSAFTHAMNVCTYAVLLARELGIVEEGDLAELAQGALLHDVGKNPAEFSGAGRPGRDLQKKLVNAHPVEGFKKFSQRDDLSYRQLMIIYQHHERWDGSGIPVGLVGAEISQWARICSVVNALANYMQAQPGSVKMPGSEAQEFLLWQAGRSLDEEMVRCWISTLKNAR